MTLRVHPDEIVGQSSSPLLGIAPWWERVPVGDVAEIINGAAFKSKQFNNEGRGMPLIRIRDVGQRNTNTFYDGEYEQRHLVSPGDLLIGMDGDFRIARWAGPAALLNQRVCRLGGVNPSHFNEKFLAYCIQPYLDAVHEVTSAVTVKHLSSRTVAQLPIPLPPLPEQERIVAAIEKHFSHLDAAETSLHRAESRAESILVSRLAQLFVGGGDVKGQLRPVSALLAHTIGGVWGDPPGSGEVDVNVMRVTEFRNDGSLEPSTAARRSISLKQLASRQLEPGDLLLEKSGGGPTQPVGRVVRLPEMGGPAVPTNFVQLLRPSPEVVPDYLFWQLWWWHRCGVVNEYQRATTNIRNLKTKDYLRREVALPPQEEQAAVAQELDELRHRVDRLRADVHRAQLRSGLLRRAVLAAAFSGQLVPQEPTDEPASVLLDRIRAEAPAKKKSTRKKKSA